MKKNNIYKKLFALSLTGVLALTHPEVSKANNNTRTEVTYSFVPTVTALTNVYLKEWADPNAKNVGVLNTNQSLQLYEETNNWYGVMYNNRIVYVNKSNVIQTNKTVMNSPILKRVRLTNSVTMYNDESYTKSICNIPYNTIVDVYLENPNTYFIYYNNQVGYINKVYTDSNLYQKVENNSFYYNYPNQLPVNPTYNYPTPVYNQYNYYGPVQNNYYYNNNYQVEQYYPNYDPVIYNNTINYYNKYGSNNSKTLVKKS